MSTQHQFCPGQLSSLPGLEGLLPLCSVLGGFVFWGEGAGGNPQNFQMDLVGLGEAEVKEMREAGVKLG